MGSTSLPRGVAVDHALRSDALLAVATVATAVVGFAALVLLPYAVAGFIPPAGADVLWRVGGPLAVVLAPLTAGLAAASSLLALWRGDDLDSTTRRLHLTVLVTVAVFAALLASSFGQAAFGWWQD
ncbi:membrane hypothetical protein [metagenome]|uniref:Uncharacterized protein n=1 Tax=metagenome TaxID=256318 RepID=A0A2P2CE08_9ZZZZ